MAVLMLTACVTGTPREGGHYRYHLPIPQESSEEWGLDADSEDEGASEGESIFATLPTDFRPVQVGDSEFTAALATLVLDIPLRVATSCSPLYVGRQLALASAPLSGEQWQSELARSYGRFCERRGTPGDCLTLFEDGPRLQDDDKRSMALALAVGPALEGVGAEVRAMLDPTRVLATVSIALAGYLALLLAPEPVSKGVAAAFTVLLWGYLGWEFFDLLRAYGQLYEDAPRASTFAELRDVGERFGRVIGPNSVRILVLVGTAAIGETAALVSKAPKLPGFRQASRAVEVNAGVRMVDAATGAERIFVSVNEGTIRVVLPVNVVSMTARNGGGGEILPNGHRAFTSFRAFKRFMGKAGKGKQWHHIVEKHKANLRRFGPRALHNTENIRPLGERLHTDLSALYSSKRPKITGSETLTVREWVRTLSYEEQRVFGLQAIENVSKGVW
ncbi:hypothetical protein [Archangium sp.]|uniref:SitA5 family polymorphic toxin n=1 Tax=Archangium sp. TaxID=1872627 RepID=UPI00286C1190|nr:hypothetical protein [Archangium sp.]